MAVQTCHVTVRDIHVHLVLLSGVPFQFICSCSWEFFLSSWSFSHAWMYCCKKDEGTITSTKNAVWSNRVNWKYETLLIKCPPPPNSTHLLLLLPLLHPLCWVYFKLVLMDRAFDSAVYLSPVQRSELTFSKSRLLTTFNCKMVAITWLSPEFWLPKIFSTCHGDQNGRSLERCSVTVIVQLTKQSYLFLTFGSHISYCYT